MPAEIKGNPQAVTLGEIWRNILTDNGSLPSVDITTVDAYMHSFEYGLYRATLGAYGNGSDGALNFVSSGSATVAGRHPLVGHLHHDPGHLRRHRHHPERDDDPHRRVPVLLPGPALPSTAPSRPMATRRRPTRRGRRWPTRATISNTTVGEAGAAGVDHDGVRGYSRLRPMASAAPGARVATTPRARTSGRRVARRPSRRPHRRGALHGWISRSRSARHRHHGVRPVASGGRGRRRRRRRRHEPLGWRRRRRRDRSRSRPRTSSARARSRLEAAPVARLTPRARSSGGGGGGGGCIILVSTSVNPLRRSRAPRPPPPSPRSPSTSPVARPGQRGRVVALWANAGAPGTLILIPA